MPPTRRPCMAARESQRPLFEAVVTPTRSLHSWVVWREDHRTVAAARLAAEAQTRQIEVRAAAAAEAALQAALVEVALLHILLDAHLVVRQSCGAKKPLTQ